MNNIEPTERPQAIYGKPPAVDWTGVYDALLYAVVDIPDVWGMKNHIALREYRTLRMGGGRQNGKTGWAVNKLAFDGYIIVAKDKDARQATERKYFLKNPRQEIKITIPADCPNPSDVVDQLLATFAKASRRKVYTVMDLQSIATEAPEKLAHITHVIIDDATFNTRTNDVYKVFAELNMFNTTFVALN